MFGLGLMELLIIGVVVLVFIPPEDLPAFIRKVGYYLGKARQMSEELGREFASVQPESSVPEQRGPELLQDNSSPSESSPEDEQSSLF